MAVDKDILIRLRVEKANAEKDLNDANQALSKLDKTSKGYEATLRRVAKAEKVAEVAQKKLTRAMTEGKSAVGAGTSATLELGRVLSDMPYGIRGVANNLQQLASNLFFMSKATDTATGKALGFKGAIGTVLKGLIGPAGVLIAFQGIIALLDYFKVGMSSATKETNEADKATKEFASSLRGLEKTLIDSGASQESYNGKIREYIALKKLEKRLEESLLSTQEQIDEKNKQFAATKENDIDLAKRLIDAKKKAAEQELKIYPDTKIGRQAKAQAVDYYITVEQLESQLSNNVIFRKTLEEDIVKLTRDGIAEITKLQDAKKELGKADKGTLRFLKQQKSDLEKIRQTSAKTSQEYEKQGIKIAEVQRLIEEIEGSSSKGKGLLKPIDLKGFEGDIFSVENMLRKFAGQELLQNAKTAEEKNTAKAIIELEGFKHNFEKFKENEDNKFAEFEKALEKKREAEIEKAKGNKARISEINALFDENSLSAQEEYEAESTISYTEYIKGLKAIADKNKPDIIIGEVDPETEADRQKILQDKKTEHFNSMLEKYIGYTQDVKKVLGAIGDFMNSEFDRELVIEQNKTNALNNELNARLANENLSKDERQAIQDEIAQNDEKLRVKQEAIERKRFKMQKALDIGMAIMDTAAAMMRALVIFGPTPVGFAAAGVAAAFGAVQIAMIARQKFQTTASGSPRAAGGSNSGGSSGGSDRADPSFNIVGMSGNSQLLEAIQSQFDKPLQAYVVSREVTRQQNLDAAIQTGAGF